MAVLKTESGLCLPVTLKWKGGEISAMTKKLGRGFFTDPEGNMRRGVPTYVIDEKGNEIPVFREHNTGTNYPRGAEKVSDDKATDEKPSE